MEKIENRQPLIEPLPTVNDYINSKFSVILIIALAIIAFVLLFVPQVFNYVFGSSVAKTFTSS